MTKYATAFRTLTVTDEIQYGVNCDFPQDFWNWDNERQYDWLEEFSSGSITVSEEIQGIVSIDNVFFDE